MRYFFEEYAFDTDCRELHRGADVVSIAPQVFDLLEYLIRNGERVVTKDDLISAVWHGRMPKLAACDAVGFCDDLCRFNRSHLADSARAACAIIALPCP